MRKALAVVVAVLCMGAAATVAEAKPPVPSVICGGSCDPGSLLPPCNANTPNMWGAVITVTWRGSSWRYQCAPLYGSWGWKPI